MGDLFDQLDQAGFVVLPGLIDRDFLSALNRRIDVLFDAEGDAAGSEFKQEAGCRRLAPTPPPALCAPARPRESDPPSIGELPAACS